MNNIKTINSRGCAMKKFFIGIAAIIALAGIIIFYSYIKISSVSEGKKIDNYNEPVKAVLIIDIQKGITDKESTYGLDRKQQKQMIKNCNRITDNSRKSGLEIIYIRQVFPDDFFTKLFTRGAMQEGSDEVKFDPGLKIISKNIFTKHIMDSFSNPELDKFLIAGKINHLYITGLDAEACVDKTIKAAVKRGYRVTIIKDAIATKSDKRRENKIKEFLELGCEIISTAELLKETVK